MIGYSKGHLPPGRNGTGPYLGPPAPKRGSGVGLAVEVGLAVAVGLAVLKGLALLLGDALLVVVGLGDALLVLGDELVVGDAVLPPPEAWQLIPVVLTTV